MSEREEVQAVYRARSAVGAAVRRGDPEAEREARQRLAVAAIRHAVAQHLAKAPRLTDEQIDHIVALLRSGAAAR